MSTTVAYVATLAPDGTTIGTHVRYDGAPATLGPVLADIIGVRGGSDAFERIKAAPGGWAYLSAKQPSTQGVTPDPRAPYGSPARVAHDLSPDGARATGYTNVPGIGLVYDRHDPVQGPVTFDPITRTGYAPPQTPWAWAYLLDPATHTLYVIQVSDPEVGHLRQVDSVPLGGLDFADWNHMGRDLALI